MHELKKGLLIAAVLIIALVPVPAHADTPPRIEWAKFYGGSLRTSGYSVRQIDDGGFVAAGWTRRPLSSNHEGYFIRTDSQGTIEWQRTFAPPNGNAEFYAVQPTVDGGFVLVGRASVASIGPQPYLVKTDLTGNLEWDRVFYTDTMVVCYLEFPQFCGQAVKRVNAAFRTRPG